ncbi:LysE family transporter [Streptomyces sp. NPDC047985]|uniref:LysE family translocator n=1 Tax=unclassified Streptomyces TaxID=2593676 RepID=UPI003417DC46
MATKNVDQLFNPKTGVFSVAVLPQFVPEGETHFSMGLLLTAVHIALGLICSSALTASTTALSAWLRKPRARRILDRVIGTVIGVFALRLGLSD